MEFRYIQDQKEIGFWACETIKARAYENDKAAQAKWDKKNNKGNPWNYDDEYAASKVGITVAVFVQLRDGWIVANPRIVKMGMNARRSGE
jgi:hypothetical protein